MSKSNGVKKFFILLLLLIVSAGCAKKNTITVADGKGGFVKVEDKSDKEKEKPKTGDVSNDVCLEFSADLVYSITGKPVVKVQPDIMTPKMVCRYFTSFDPNFFKDVPKPELRGGGAHIFIMLENMNVATQKKGIEILGATIKTDDRIKMEHMITLRKNGSIWDIRLIINPNRYVRMDYSYKALTDDELIDFAAKIAQKIQGTLSMDIKNNPIELKEEKTEEIGASQQQVVNSFFENLSGKKISETLAMMDADEKTKQMWGVNFNTIKSLRVVKTEEVFKEEWTSTRQTYKVELDVEVKSEGEQLGWEKGKNYRWITLEKDASGTWMIHELANNP